MNRTPHSTPHRTATFTRHVILCLALVVCSISAAHATDCGTSDSTSIAKEQSLSGVVIKSERPQLKTDGNGCITFDAKQLELNHPMTSALDLLDEISLADKDTDGSVRVIGTSKTTIIINGRKNQMSTAEINAFLSSIAPSQIKTIEIYQAAPPQLGIDGGVINFILEQKRGEKTNVNGSIWTSLYQGRKYFNTGGISLNAYKKKWMLTAAFSLGNMRETKNYDLSARHNVDGQDHEIFNASTRYTKNHATKITADFTYDLSKTQSINVSYLYRTDNPRYRFTSPLLIDHKLDSDNKGDFYSYKETHTFLINYKLGECSMGGDIVLFHNGNGQNMQNYIERTNILVSSATQNSLKGTLYINSTLQTGKGKLNYGTDLLWTHTQNAFANTWTDTATHESEHTNKDNTQNEHEWKVYGGWTQSTKKMSLSTSVTIDYFKSTFRQDGQKCTLWNNVTLMPNANFHYKIDGKHTIMASFYISRTYPTYAITSGRKAYYNSYFYIENNPKVTAYNTYNSNIKYVIKSKYIIGLYSIIEPNKYMQIVYQDPHNLTTGLQYHNFSTNNKLGLQAVVPQRWSTQFDSRLAAYVSYNTSSGQANDISFDKSMWSANFMLTNNVVMDRKRTAALQINLIYTTDVLAGYSIEKHLFRSSVSLTWRPKNTGWSVILKCNNPLDTAQPMRITKYHQQSSTFQQNQDNRKVNLTVRYSLKGYKEKKIKEVDTSRMGL